MFFFQAEDGIRDGHVTGVQTCALPISFYTVNPSAGINYQLFEHSRWFANFSTSFESPTTTELKNRLGEDGMILPGFNHDLSPERTSRFETGFRGAVPSQNMAYD